LKRSACYTNRIADSVAPHAGAWIETKTTPNITPTAKSPPMRGRGLKHDVVGWAGPGA